MNENIFYEFTEEQLNVLKKQLEEKKLEQHDLGIQIKEIDLHLNELLDVQIRKRKKELKSLRHDLASQQYTNATSIANLERAIYEKGYYSKEVKENDNGRIGNDSKTIKSE